MKRTPHRNCFAILCGAGITLALVAQLDRASAFEAEGSGFKSWRGRKNIFNQTNIMPVSTIDIIIRLLITFVLAGLIGIEREHQRKPAGLRTNIMVGLGSTLMTLAYIQAADLFRGSPVDPTRIAAQIVTGIGFLGAGTIINKGPSVVVGLTTAATLWVVAGIGIAVGFGFYLEAIIVTALVFFTFFVLSRLVNWLRKRSKAPEPENYEKTSES